MTHRAFSSIKTCKNDNKLVVLVANVLNSSAVLRFIYSHHLSFIVCVTGVKPSRNSLTLEEKIKIVYQISSGISNADVCRKFGLSSSTVSTIWKNRDKIRGTLNSNISKLKRIRRPVNNEVDRALLEWFKQKRSQNIPISGSILQQKAEEFSKLLSPNNEESVCSKGWVDRFKKRYHISSSKIHGEAASVSLQTTRDWLEKIWPEIRRGYSDNDIFNGDETGYFKLT